MIQVVSRNEKDELKPLNFDTNALEVIDGALIIYTMDAGDFWAGFAPGEWVTFQRLDVG